MTDVRPPLPRPASTILTLLAIPFSGLIGSVTTVIHQSTNSLLGLSIPWGLVLALLIVAAWMIGLLLLNMPRWGLVLCGIALLAMVVLLSQTGPGGSVLVPESWLGNVWVIVCPLIVVVGMFWPRLPRRSPNSAGEAN